MRDRERAVQFPVGTWRMEILQEYCPHMGEDVYYLSLGRNDGSDMVLGEQVSGCTAEHVAKNLIDLISRHDETRRQQ